jgi:hypothetical protein
MPAAALWTTAAEVGQDGFTNGGHKWNLDSTSSLERCEDERVTPPGDVLQGKQANLLGTHPISE